MALARKRASLSRRELANAVRALSMDAVERAGSGHPGAPMGMADIAEVLWNDFLRHNPENPQWPDRDRFVMSNGHGSMLLYSLLHLSGYDLPMEELRRFRQLGSRTPGHPERGETPGVETTTGPLGQGLANAVGMALAERALAARFNRDGAEIVNHRTYVSVGEGCLMEGLSHEAAALAGVLGLGKLIALFDNNGVSIDGDVAGWFIDDTAARFAACGWHVVRDIDGHDPERIRAAIEEAQACAERPSLICFRTVIGWGSPGKQGSADCHGAPLGAGEVARCRERLGWGYAPFEIPGEYYQAWDARARGRSAEARWRERFEDYRRRHPEPAAEFERRMRGELPAEWPQRAREIVAELSRAQGDMATRKASQQCLEAFGALLPELIGGSADLSGSNLTAWSGSRPNGPHRPDGNYIHYGVREFAMVAVNSGLALHGGFVPYGGTFLVFSDYARNGLRLAALMRLRNIFVFTHDSIGLGEDGPTHQPLEHAASLRLVPNMSLWRPCDAAESAQAWRAALERRDGPTSLLFSRQSLPRIERTPEQTAAIRRGGYVLAGGGAAPELLLIATGSEVSLALGAAEDLTRRGRRVRVVSMPSMDVFERQDRAYRDSVLPPSCRLRIAVEAGVADCWHRYLGERGRMLGVQDFGVSAPGAEVFRHFRLTREELTRLAVAMLGDSGTDDSGTGGAGTKAATEAANDNSSRD